MLFQNSTVCLHCLAGVLIKSNMKEKHPANKLTIVLHVTAEVFTGILVSTFWTHTVIHFTSLMVSTQQNSVILSIIK